MDTRNIIYGLTGKNILIILIIILLKLYINIAITIIGIVLIKKNKNIYFLKRSHVCHCGKLYIEEG